MKVTVYRIEHKINKTGPYQMGDSSCWRTRCHDYNKITIQPLLCSKLKDKWLNLPESDDYIFGFSTKKAVTRWFTKKELKNLENLGYVLKSYKVSKENIIKGTNQIVFKKA